MNSSLLDRLTATLGALTLGLLLAGVAGTVLLPAAPSTGTTGYHPLGAPSRPVRLVVPSLKIKAPVAPIHLTGDGALNPPSDTHEVGWWDASARPGAGRGQTVLTGHTVHTGGGVLNDLGRLRPGARVLVVTPHGTLTYRATRVVTYTKAQLARHSVDLFAQKRAHPRLVLITCTGWTGHDYTSNIVAFAQPLGVRERS